jgi:hypothetical protein
MGEVEQNRIDPWLLLTVLKHEFEHRYEGGNDGRDKDDPAQNAFQYGDASSLLIRHGFPLFRRAFCFAVSLPLVAPFRLRFKSDMVYDEVESQVFFPTGVAL